MQFREPYCTVLKDGHKHKGHRVVIAFESYTMGLNSGWCLLCSSTLICLMHDRKVHTGLRVVSEDHYVQAIEEHPGFKTNWSKTESGSTKIKWNKNLKGKIRMFVNLKANFVH